MSSIILATEDYQDLILVYLLDLLTHGNGVENPLFDKFLKKLNGAGLKGPLLNYVLSMNAQNRILYSIVRPELTGGNGRAVLTVSGDMKSSEDEEK
jgi:hypothetical protein